MKTVIATLVALSAAMPALANDQLALSLGVEPGKYTTAELAVIKSRSSLEGNDGRVFIDNTRFAPTRSIHNSTALAQFDKAREESDGSN